MWPPAIVLSKSGLKKEKMGALASKTSKQEPAVSTNDFKIKELLGRGSFSSVKLVKHKKTGLTYAMKIIKKNKIKRSGVIRNIILEKSILESIECPFIGNLRYAFQDSKNLFMVMDLLSGGDLRQNLINHKFTENEVKHIISEVACGIEYIHQNGIIHRDVKPENIMFDLNGHAYIIDFNVSVYHSYNENVSGAAGSSNYMAPEVLNGKTYDESIDWWSLGVVAYEMIFNKRPFYATNKRGLLESIKNGLNFEKMDESATTTISENLKKFLLLILEPDKEVRLGAGSELRGISSIRKTKWLLDQDWESIISRNTRPPFVPKNPTKSNMDKKIILIDKLSMYGLLSRDSENFSISTKYSNSGELKRRNVTVLRSLLNVRCCFHSLWIYEL